MPAGGVNRGSAPMRDPVQLVVFGASGNTPEILETIRAINEASADGPQFACFGCLDDNQARWGTIVDGIPVLGPVSAAQDFPACRFVNGIGGPGSFWRRPQIVANAGVPADRYQTLVHPTAAVASTARLGCGTVLFAHVTVGAHAAIADHVLVLPASVVSHDVTVGAHTSIASGVCISSHVSVGGSCYLGTGCCIINATRIGDRALIGMGSVVLHDVDAETVVAGNPARFLRAVRTDDAAAPAGQSR